MNSFSAKHRKQHTPETPVTGSVSDRAALTRLSAICRASSLEISAHSRCCHLFNCPSNTATPPAFDPDPLHYLDAPSTIGDGSGTLPGPVQPFEYTPDAVSGDIEELATSTNNLRYAAKMLGYEQNAISDMLHAFKPANGLGPADNVIFHDDGGIEFNGQMLDDNIHNYAS